MLALTRWLTQFGRNMEQVLEMKNILIEYSKSKSLSLTNIKQASFGIILILAYSYLH